MPKIKMAAKLPFIQEVHNWTWGERLLSVRLGACTAMAT